ELLAHVAELGALALALLAGALQLGPHALALALQVLLEALPQALLVLGPAAPGLVELGLGRRLGLLDGAPRLALGLLHAGAVQPLGLGLGVDLLAAAQRPGDARAGREADQQQEHAYQHAHDGSPAKASSSATGGQPVFAPALPAAMDSMTARLISSTRSGLVLRSSTAFSLPCPKRVSPYENQLPDFCTTSRSLATCTRSPKRSMPRPKRMSTSASRKGGATLFFVTF